MPQFVHLHTHSHYSLLDGLAKLDDLVARAKEFNQPALALTDHGTMYGIVEFYQETLKAGIKPILGVEAYVSRRRLTDKQPRIDDHSHHLVLLAKDLEGYKNLMFLTSKAHLDGFYYKPRVDKELLKEHSRGLIAMSACMAGEIPRAMRTDYDLLKMKKLVDEYLDIFGEENFYLELQDHPEFPPQNDLNKKIIQLARDLNLPMVVTKDIHYVLPDDAEAQDVLSCISTGKQFDDPKRMHMSEVHTYMSSTEEIVEHFSHVPEAYENTVKIAERCNVEISLGKWFFPPIQLEEGKTHDDVLREKSYAGAEKLIGEVTDFHAKRLDYELDIIKTKGYAQYFLAVADYAEWARNQNIVVTTRGSAAGSLVSYCVGIVSVNPLIYNLPFERFLNPFRPSAPDVDFDVQDNRREELIQYIVKKYGASHVAQICTFGTMAARASVRDVGRVLGYPYSFCDKISKLIPMGSQGFPMTIKKALEITPELKELYDNDPAVTRLLDLAKRVEGSARHISVHAAGVVIAPDDLMNHTPIQRDPGGGDRIITQYEMHAIGEDGVGLLKMDLLGIRNLSILGNAVSLVEKTKGIRVELQKIPVDDKKTFELLARGETVGLFQLSGDGMTKYLKELRPAKITDIMMMVALYRPGPIDSIPEFIRRKNNPELVKFLHPKLEKILETSYGLLTYQDDVMLTAIELAGYNWQDADKFRKAMGKKIPEEMAKQKEKFFSGCRANQVDDAVIEELWHQIAPFAAYGFNKAHACSYGWVAYQTAYMKANFPAEYMASIMTAESADLEKIAEIVEECSRMGIKVLPPDVNESFQDFTYIDEKQIRFGLAAIKNIGDHIVGVIIEERKNNGNYKDLSDFLTRVNDKDLNRKSLESLVKCGAMDSLGERNQLLGNTEKMLSFAHEVMEEKSKNQNTLFGPVDVRYPKVILAPFPPADSALRLAWERELLGLFVSGHPFREYEKALAGRTAPLSQLIKRQEGSGVVVAGFVSTVKQIMTKNNEQMAFVQLEDTSAKVEVIVFPKTFQTCKELLIADNKIIVRGKLSERDGGGKILADKIELLDLNNLDKLFNKVGSAPVVYKPTFYGEKPMTPVARPATSPSPFVPSPFAEASVDKSEISPSLEIWRTGRRDKLAVHKDGRVSLFYNPVQHKDLNAKVKEILARFGGETPVDLVFENNGQKYRLNTGIKVGWSDGCEKELGEVLKK